MAELTVQKRRAWIGPVIGLSLIALTFVFWAGASFWFGVFRMRSQTRYGEAFANLKAAYVAETSYFKGTGRYEESVEEVGFLPERGNRYRYVFSQTGDSFSPGDPPDGGAHTSVLADAVKYPTANNALLLSGIPPALLSTAGIDSTGITIIAAGDIDSDPTIDVWSISTNNRIIDGGVVKAGTPFRHVNDSEY